MQDVEQLNHKARAHYDAGRHAQAEKLYRKLLSLDEHNHHALLMVGLCRQYQHDAEGALTFMERAVAVEDNDPELHFQLGRHLLDMQRLDQGRESLAQAIALNPNHIAARTLFGYSFISTQDYARAIKELRIARRADVRYAPTAIMLSLALLESGELEEAAREANLAVQLAPENPGAHSVLGNVLLVMGNAHFAEHAFRTALQSHPHNLELQAGLGRALALGGEWQEAARILGNVLDGGLQTAEIVHSYAHTLAALDRLDQARSVLHRIPPQMRDEAFHILLADIEIGRGDVAGAHAAIDALPEENSQKTLLGARLARAEGEPGKAVEMLTPLFENADAKVARQARLMCAESCFASQDSERAYEVIEPLLSGERPDLRAVELWTGFLHREGRWAALLAFLEPLLETIDLPELARARANGLMVHALDALGQTERAAALLDAAAWREPDFLRAYASEAFRELRDAQLTADDEYWRSLAVEGPAARQSPVFVFGWAGSGQRELISALSAHPDMLTLSAANLDERTRIYRELSDPRSAPPTSEQIENLRLHCLPAEDFGDQRVLDPATYEVALLPGIARLFPAATVIVLSAQEADLHLHWMFSGYRQPLDILDAYRRELELFNHLRPKLPLDLIVVPRHQLLNEPVTALEPLLKTLALSASERPAAVFREAAQRLRADGHWKHYAETLGRD